MLRISTIALTGAAMSLSVGVQASHPVEEESKPTPEVIERDADGNVTKVKIGDRVVDVCTPQKQDSCINPRDAGLDQGRPEINYWPGKPASEIEGPLPVEEPVESGEDYEAAASANEG